MDKITDLLKDFYKHFAGIGIYMIPGLFVLETVFARGFFHNNINNIYSFILYLIWSLILGLPFHYGYPKKFYSLAQAFKNRSTNKDPEHLKNLQEEIEIGFVFSKIFTFYILYKFLIWQNFIVFDSICNLKTNIANYIIAVLLNFIISFLTIYIYKWYMEKMYL